ncbi:MAG: 30S ribosomal protein S16 [Parachlamydiales bacterium]|nr:30S ribosomal protein S16 [Parachlamydiales bacterium]
MALTIRFRQMGKRNRQTFRLVVIDKRSPRDGKYVEMVGWYNPFAEGEKNTSINAERILFWLDKGAQMTLKAKALIKRTAPEVMKSLNEKKLVKVKKVVAKAKTEKKIEKKVEKKAAKPKAKK